jgi:eukaryotic-like serine/threonine-protein kinase
MNPDRWQQVKRVLDGALAAEVSGQPGYLDQACNGDLDLRGEVESLLQHHQLAATGFLKQPAILLEEPGSESDAPSPRIGRRVGVYQILEEIGHGGMGAVYRAARVDGQYEKQVAVKLVRGGYDTSFVLERFRQERQILASLDHPNIGRLLDGGTTEDGVPYLVMELIEGKPIDQYCDGRDLNVTERLRLFRQVCGAVQYAHQRLVIHRDIKPSNILVTSEGVPKLLDFGIAKILDPSTNSEMTLLHPLTPGYASPEQVRGEPITTASDVYSLGVVLYQLLAGSSPYCGTPTHEMARAVCEVEPLRPSTVSLRNAQAAGTQKLRLGSAAKLHRRLAGDLDNIVLKALRKEPQRRYGSAEQFGEDIRRHLDGLPVTARQGSWNYRAGKFIRRHKAGVAASLIVAITLLAGMAVTLREKRIAEHRFNDVRKLANSLIFEVHDSIRDLPGSTEARKLLVSRGLQYLDSLNQQAKGDASLQEELAAAYEKVGDVLGYPYAANLGDPSGALQSYRKAMTIRESLAAAQPSESRLLTLTSDYMRMANLLESTGDLNGALAEMRKALPITQRLAATSSSATVADQLGGSYYFTAMILGQMGDRAGELQTYQQAASTHEAGLRVDASNMKLRSHLAGDYAGMALSLKKRGDLAQATPLQIKAVQILEEVSQANPNVAPLREYLGEAVSRLAGFRKDQGDPAGALEMYRRAHEIFQQLVAADPKNSLAKANLGFAAIGIANSLVSSGQPDSALPTLQAAIATFQAISPETGNRYVRTGLASSYSGLGGAYSIWAADQNLSASERRKKWREARSWYEKSLGVWNEKAKRAELESDEREELQIATANIARCDSALQAAGQRAAK